MIKRRIIGVMTGNSMDAIDVVLTEFVDNRINDVCSLSVPYKITQKQQVNLLRQQIAEKKLMAWEILHLAEFKRVHDEYVEGVAAAINELCAQNNIAKNSIDAIGFHGKTLDHNPPSVAVKNGTQPYTIQMGSAQMLADLVGVPVVNDFRSQLIMRGFEGAPLAAPHNAHLAAQEGDGCYFNAGNTSNLAWIKKAQPEISFDVGPFNEYIDSFVLRYKGIIMDVDARYGKRGKLLTELMAKLYEFGREYYDLPLPKSGDPSYYKTAEIFAYIEEKLGNPSFNEQLFCDVVHTFEYFAAYLAALGAASTSNEIEITPRFILFGGGWKNPLVFDSFCKILCGEGVVLPEHQKIFAAFKRRIGNKPEIKYSSWGTYMEARVFADLAYCYLENKSWELAELNSQQIILGYIRYPHRGAVDDYLSRASRGWQNF